MSFLCNKCYPYKIIKKKATTNKVGPTKKINQLNIATWKKITSKSSRKIKDLFISLQYN
jgi:hypothetical protein